MRRINRQPVPLPVFGGVYEALWDTIASIAVELEGVPWTIVGGQMVLLHGLEHGVAPTASRPTSTPPSMSVPTPRASRSSWECSSDSASSLRAKAPKGSATGL